MPGKPGYNEHPTEEDRIHCLAFVLNAHKVSYMEENLIKKMKAIRAEAKGRSMDISIVLVLIIFQSRSQPNCDIDKRGHALSTDNTACQIGEGEKSLVISIFIKSHKINEPQLHCSTPSYEALYLGFRDFNDTTL